ncbi:DNA-directed RNA polymerase subunit alpha [Candidatus Berkelbacteria bacterium]|nr:DNA-directed RNA polymerase subunit alpha [Candidatus Berkelbacteria bacterium]
MYTLPELENVKVTEESESDRVASFIIEPLLPGYGMTVGHSLRRVLLTSLEGAAVAYVKIQGTDHEFTTLKGMREDIVELILNLKSMRVRLNASEPVLMKLDKKGTGIVTAADFAKHADVDIIDPDHYLATLDKDGKLSMEVTIERGRGYLPTEQKSRDQLPIGTIAVDSIFTPIKKVHYEVEHTRVGGQTDYDKLSLELTTDGSVTPAEAMAHASTILIEHFTLIRDAANKSVAAKIEVTAKKKKRGKKTE